MFLVSCLALAACDAASTSGVAPLALTTEFDGDYELYVSRVSLDTPDIQNDPNDFVGKENELYRVVLSVSNGTANLKSLREGPRGPNFADLSSTIDANGVFRFSATANYLYSKRSTGKLQFESKVGDQLLSGQRISLAPGNWTDDYGQLVQIRKL